MTYEEMAKSKALKLFIDGFSANYMESKLYQEYGGKVGIKFIKELVEKIVTQSKPWKPLYQYDVGTLVKFSDNQLMFIIEFQGTNVTLEPVDGHSLYYAHISYPAQSLT